MPEEGRTNKLAGLLVALIAFLVYANSLGNGFVTDDHSVILNNPALQGTPLSLFSTIDTTSDTLLLPFYRPLTYLTFLVENRLHGMNPFLVRLFNVLLHSANAFLVYRLARTFCKDNYAALLAGLLFAVHPLHTEGVDFNAGGRNTMLASLFVLMAYLAHHGAVVRGLISRSFAGAALFLAGLLSKESAMAIVPFIAALEITPLRTGAAGSRLRAVIRLLPYATATLCYLVLRWVTLSKLGIQPTIIPGFGTGSMERQYIVPPLWERLLDNVYIIPHYLLTVIWPTSLSPIYVTPDDLKPLALPLAAAWLFIIGILAWLLTKGRSGGTLFGLSWLIAFWLPVSGIVYFSDTVMADRYLYLPGIGLWIIVADQVVRLFPAGSMARRYAMPVALLVLLLLASLTVRRNLDWKNDITLCSRLIEQYPKNPYGHANLGAAYIERRGEGDLQLAEKEFETALALDPATAQDVYTPLGYIKLTKGDFKAALYYYSKALEISPGNRDARINRGITYERLGMNREALADYQQYLSISSHNDIPGSREYAEERIRELSR